MKLHLIVLLTTLVIVLTSCIQKSKYDVIITGGTIVDGLGNKPFLGDLAIKGDLIVEISTNRLDTSLAKASIDASGLIVSPGFIDLHTNVEVNIQDVPLADNFVNMGVTSILASLHGGDQPYPLDTYASKLEVAPNMGYFAGHSWIRKRVMGWENRYATSEELDSMKYYVEQTMKQGALGLATGLEYPPANFAAEEEIVVLAKVAAKYGGIYITHMRDEGRGLLQSIEESIMIGKEANISVEINHLKAAGKSQWGWSVKALLLLDSARTAGIKIAQDVYPYTAYSTYSYILIPQWAMEGGREGLNKRLQEPETIKKIKEEMAEIISRDAGGADLSRIQFRQFDQMPEFTGKTLADYAASLGLPQTLATGIDLLLEIEGKGGFYGIFHAMDEADLIRFMQNSNTMFDSDGDLIHLGDGHPHPRCYGTFPKVLGTYVRDKKIISLEEAIKRMTSLPANKINQTKRGRIKTGTHADITIFDFENIKDNSTYTDPHHFPSGIHHVLINGVLVLTDGQLTGKKPGQWLRGPGLINNQ